MHFCIRACDVSALAGRNTFRSRQVAIRRLIEGKLGNTTNRPNENRMIVSLIRGGKCYQEAVKCSRLSQYMCTTAEEECKAIIKQHTGVDSATLYKRYRHLYLKDRGIVVEQIAIDMLRALGYNIPVVSKKERSFTKTFETLSGDHTYTVYGCVDSFEEGKDGFRTLLEIKSRKRCPVQYTHEIDQIIVYLVISGCRQASLVEYINEDLYISKPTLQSFAQLTWDSEIRGPLETSLSEAAQQLIDVVA